MSATCDEIAQMNRQFTDSANLNPTSAGLYRLAKVAERVRTRDFTNAESVFSDTPFECSKESAPVAAGMRAWTCKVRSSETGGIDGEIQFVAKTNGAFSHLSAFLFMSQLVETTEREQKMQFSPLGKQFMADLLAAMISAGITTAGGTLERRGDNLEVRFR